MMIIKQIPVRYMDNFCYIIGWEKRNNVNAKEYGYYVEN
jgi:hypothetical protein